mgnify:CR=1 FL=1
MVHWTERRYWWHHDETRSVWQRLIFAARYTIYRLHKLLQVWPSANRTADDHPFVILPSAKIYCSKTASNIFSHPPRRQRCNTLHFASKEVRQTFPLDSLKKSIYLQLRRRYILFFNHHWGIEPCDDYIVNVVSLQIYYVDLFIPYIG